MPADDYLLFLGHLQHLSRDASDARQVRKWISRTGYERGDLLKSLAAIETDLDELVRRRLDDGGNNG